MDGFREGLEVLIDVEADKHQHVATDLSTRYPWTSFVGEALTEVCPSFHVPNEGQPAMLWSLACKFGEDKGFVTIALGEVRGGSLSYSPDGLVIIFEESSARTYQPLGATLPALACE
jgi:hypothetical protein